MKIRSLLAFPAFTPALVLIMIAAFALTAHATIYTITTTADSGEGSLRAAIGAANSSEEDDTINLNIPATDPDCQGGTCTIRFNGPESISYFGIDGAGKLTIQRSPYANNVIIDGNDLDRVFIVRDGADFTLSGITVVGGNCYKNLDEPYNGGGGIYNKGGRVKLINSTVAHNIGGNSYGGGGITNFGNMTLTDSSVEANNGAFGGVFNEAVLVLIRSSIRSNTGFGLANLGGSATADHSTISGNDSAVANTGPMEIINTIISGNTKGDSSYIDNHGTLTITSSILRDNASGIGNYSSKTAGTGVLNVVNSTIDHNGSSGSSYAPILTQGETPVVTVVNSTFTNNTGALAGAIFAFAGSVTLINSTIAKNTSTGLIGGIWNYGGTFSLRNTIVAENVVAGKYSDIYDDPSNGTVISQGNNLIGHSDDTGVSWLPSDILDQSPRLGPLGNYGGATMTLPLTNNSPAINAGNSCVITLNGCGDDNPALAFDQRGAARVDAVDIGAFERNNPITGGQFRAVTTEGRTNTPYNYLLTPDSGAFTYSVTGGSLPPGITLTNSARPATKNSLVPAAGPYSITGTPTMGGTFDYTITATDGTNAFTVNYSTTIVTPPPTAASVNVGGRVIALGRGLANARVVLADQNGQTRTALSNAFGYYQFDNVTAGETYIISIRAKRYQFAPQLISVTDEITDLVFSAE